MTELKFTNHCTAGLCYILFLLQPMPLIYLNHKLIRAEATF